MGFNVFDAPVSNSDFISVVIMSLGRPDRTKNLVESIHRHADMPVEIVITDDGSSLEQQQELLLLKDKVARIVLNTGLNIGLAGNANVGVEASNSKYILVMNDDCEIRLSFFKDLCKVLDTPYIGAVGVLHSRDYTDQPVVEIAGNKLILSTICGAATQAFTRDLYNEVGGFPQDIVNTVNGDLSFYYRIMSHGYFNVCGWLRDEVMVYDTGRLPDQVHMTPDVTSSISMKNCEVAYPSLYPGVDNLELAGRRSQIIAKRCRVEEVRELGIANTNSWTQYLLSFWDRQEKKFNWDKFITPHTRWREQVERDLVNG